MHMGCVGVEGRGVVVRGDRGGACQGEQVRRWERQQSKELPFHIAENRPLHGFRRHFGMWGQSRQKFSYSN